MTLMARPIHLLQALLAHLPPEADKAGSKSTGAFYFKRRCIECSVYNIKVPREPFERIGSICSRGTLM